MFACEWSGSLPPQDLHIVLGPDEFHELFIPELRTYTGLVDPNQMVYVARGLYRSQHELVAILATSDQDSLYSLRNPLTQLVAELICNFTNPVGAQYEVLRRWSSIRDAPDVDPALLPSISLLVDLYAFLEELYLSCGTVILRVSRERRKPWWIGRPEAVVELEKWRKRLKTESEQGRKLDSFTQKLDQIHSVLRNIERSSGATGSDCFVAASAFCFACAETHLSRDAAAPALMLANRATEYLLTALAVEGGLAGLDGNGVVLRGATAVGVRELTRVLVEEGILSSRTEKAEVLLAVNATRNQLSFTHGLGAVRTEHVRVTLTQLASFLRAVDPDLGWWSKLVAVRPRLPDARAAVGRLLEFDTLVQVYDSESLRTFGTVEGGL